MHNRRKSIKWISILLTFLLLLTLTGCGGYRVGGKALEKMKAEDMDSVKLIYDQTMTIFQKGQVELLNNLSGNAKITFEDAWETWETYRSEYGEFQSHEIESAYIYGEDTIVIGYITLENGRVAIDVLIDSKDQIKQVEVYLPGKEEEAMFAMPEGIEEKEVIIGEGSEYPLNGMITMPKGAEVSQEQYPAVVLIHGTGANDMNMTAGNTRMLRDLAWGLAEQGIISIRYDKRTSVAAYAEEMESNPNLETMTVHWDIAEDALLATTLLRDLPCVDSDRIYAAGHSLGGLILPRLDAEGGDYAGYIMMAVPDTTWQEAAFRQYLNYGLANMDSDDIYYACRFLESQKKDIDKKLDTYSEEELIKENLLGMPAIYWKDLNSMDYVAAYEACEKPILLLQGEADYQIRADENYEGWQEKIGDHENVTLVLYEGINHLFMRSQGCFMGSSMEYTMPNHVEAAVIEDMAAFMNE